MSLSVLVEEQSKMFPLNVTLVRGLENQVFPKSTMSVHFLKQTKARHLAVLTMTPYMEKVNLAHLEQTK